MHKQSVNGVHLFVYIGPHWSDENDFGNFDIGYSNWMEDKGVTFSHYGCCGHLVYQTDVDEFPWQFDVCNQSNYFICEYQAGMHIYTYNIPVKCSCHAHC